MGKIAAILFILILAILSLILVRPSFGQSITKPSIPQFNVKFVNASYDIPITYSIDPYTGQNLTHPSYHVDNSSIELIIKNQPFVPYVNTNTGFKIWFYDIRMKGHFAENWTDLYSVGDVPVASGSQYTILSYKELPYSNSSGIYVLGDSDFQFPAVLIDFPVEAMMGYCQVHEAIFPAWFFTGETSGWSDT